MFRSGYDFNYLEKLNLSEIVDSYLALKELENNSSVYYGNLDILVTYLPKGIRDLLLYIDDNFTFIGLKNKEKK